jgi:hypothetical protein
VTPSAIVEAGTGTMLTATAIWSVGAPTPAALADVVQRRSLAQQRDETSGLPESLRELRASAPTRTVCCWVVVSVLGGECQPVQRLEARSLKVAGAVDDQSLEGVSLIALHRDVACAGVHDTIGEAGCPCQPAIVPIARAIAILEVRGAPVGEQALDFATRPLPVRSRASAGSRLHSPRGRCRRCRRRPTTR